MSNIPICRTFSCPYFSEGKIIDGSTYGYGCQKFTVAGLCPVNVVKHVSSTEYELFLDEGKASLNIENAIASLIAQMFFASIGTREARDMKLAEKEFNLQEQNK